MSQVASLGLATAAFVGTHFLMSHPLRRGLVGKLAQGGFTGLYSVVAFLTLGWMILAWRSIEGSTPLWIAPLWWWPVASGIMLFALILLVGSFARNPALPHPGAKARADRPATGVFAITRHPMNWSFTLWALVHIFLWGSPRNLIVAGGILILALLGSVGQDAKKRKLYPETWGGWEAKTSFVPFAALVAGTIPWRSALPGWLALIMGIVLWLAITWYHSPLVSPIGGLGRT
ncbi:MAG TPA: NnrU family protein, partial [Allosphingosinicella sp.]|nr:NnrU family protein [Allosphingosinicella sp.]